MIFSRYNTKKSSKYVKVLNEKEAWSWLNSCNGTSLMLKFILIKNCLKWLCPNIVAKWYCWKGWRWRDKNPGKKLWRGYLQIGLGWTNLEHSVKWERSGKLTKNWAPLVPFHYSENGIKIVQSAFSYCTMCDKGIVK